MSATEHLTAAHWRQLVTDSAILPEVLAEEDIRSMPSSLGLPTPDRALQHRNTHKGQYFGQWGETDAHGRPIDLGPGLWFGTRDVNGRLSGQYKPDKSRTAFNGHSVKYETCRGTRPSFAVPRCCLEALVSSMCDVFITEGYKKALALASAGVCAISLAGVDSWLMKPDPNDPTSEPISDFEAVSWRGRIVWIAYDSDAVLKRGVQRAEDRLKRELESRGAVVMVVRIPHASDGSKRGVDDYIRDRLAANVTREEAVRELKAGSLAELAYTARKRAAAPSGGDGAETCRTCDKRAEDEREQRSWDLLRKRGGFSPNETAILKHYAERAATAAAQGDVAIKANTEVTAARTGVSPAAISRTHKVIAKLQKDQEIKDRLPFTIGQADPEPGDYRKPWQIIVQVDQHGKPVTRSTAEIAEQLATICRPKMNPDSQGDGRHGGARWRCPKSEHERYGVEEAVRRMYRCLAPGCAERWESPLQVRTIGEADSEAVQDEIRSDPFNTGDRVPPVDVGTLFHHDEYPSLDIGTRHDETTPLMPAPFTSREDAEFAAGPRYQGTAPPPEAPPAEDIPWFSPRWKPPAEGAAVGAA